MVFLPRACVTGIRHAAWAPLGCNASNARQERWPHAATAGAKAPRSTQRGRSPKTQVRSLDLSLIRRARQIISVSPAGVAIAGAALAQTPATTPSGPPEATAAQSALQHKDGHTGRK